MSDEIWSSHRTLLNYEGFLSKYEDSHVKDKTVVRRSYIYNGNPYTGIETAPWKSVDLKVRWNYLQFPWHLPILMIFSKGLHIKLNDHMLHAY